MKKTNPSARRKYYLAALLLASFLLTLTAVLVPLLQSSLSPVPREGEIAGRDFRAPRAITFSSQVLTDQRKETAERAVLPIYTSADTRVARRQLEQLRSTLAYINSVRADPFATLDQKLSDLAALDDILLKRETVETILGMTDARWQEVQQEAIVVLEKVMSNSIRPDTLSNVRSQVPALVTLSLSEEQAAIVAELATTFVAPNSEYSESLTQAAREAARASVQPVTRTFVLGQTIALQGEVLGSDDIEALQQLGLTEPERDSQDLLSAGVLTALLVTLLVLYLRRKQVFLAADVRYPAVLAALMLAYLGAARYILPGNTLVAYAFPLASCSLVTAALFGTELGLVTAIPLSILAAFGLPNSMELTLFYMISSLFGVLALGRARRLITFFWAGLAVAVSGTVVVIVYQLPLPSMNLENVAILSSAAFFNGLVSASLSILLHALLAPFLGMVTPIQLLDLTRPDHPLLGRLLRDAPGTYQHSLQVASLAEQAAERIGVDPLLIRAGALYHDVGKAANAAFFIENQPPGLDNPHAGLTAEESARIIIAHVSDGLGLARKYRLPKRIMDFISEHHGTTVTRYQYYNAVKTAGDDESLVNKDLFRYPGPRPQSRETAILMLADACEARVRAERPTEEDVLRNIIKEVISGRSSSGQLDDTRLSLRDLKEIIDSFTVTLRGIYHPRINYPNQEIPASYDAITIPLARKSEAPANLDVN
jgi:putative nucleotidyltransferase with HDIG domain